MGWVYITIIFLAILYIYCLLKSASDADDRIEKILNKEENNKNTYND
jgi:hypothetical protein